MFSALKGVGLLFFAPIGSSFCSLPSSDWPTRLVWFWLCDPHSEQHAFVDWTTSLLSSWKILSKTWSLPHHKQIAKLGDLYKCTKVWRWFLLSRLNNLLKKNSRYIIPVSIIICYLWTAVDSNLPIYWEMYCEPIISRLSSPGIFHYEILKHGIVRVQLIDNILSGIDVWCIYIQGQVWLLDRVWGKVLRKHLPHEASLCS